MNDIDYNLLRMLPQDQAMAYLREKLAGNIGQISSSGGTNEFDPVYYTAAGGREMRPTEGGGFSTSVTPMFDPQYEGGVYGNYEGVYDKDGKLIDVKFKKGERHEGFLSENLDWIGPLVVGGAMAGGALAGGLGGATGAPLAGEMGGTVMATEGAGGAGGIGGGLGGTGGMTLTDAQLTNMLGAQTEPLVNLSAGGQGLTGGAGFGDLGSGTFGMNSAYTTPGLAAMEAGTLPVLTPEMTALGYTGLPSQAALGAGTLGLATGPGAAGPMSFLDASRAAIAAGAPAGVTPTLFDRLVNRAGTWAADKLTDPKTIASLALTAAGTLGGSGSGASTASTSGPARTPAQEEIFNRKNRSWDWDQISRDAAAAGLSLPQYVARNWNRVSSGAYNKPLAMAYGGCVPAMATGGLSQVAALARGGGSGRADTIPARLSDGEYVMDAETVALLGDGSTNEGARRLDNMRKQVRAHKGRALVQGRFSPDARSPLAYMKGFK